MTRIVRVDRVEACQDILAGIEGQQPLAGRKRGIEPGVVGKPRTPGGEVTGAPVAEPAGSRSDVAALRDAELSARSADEPPVLCGSAGGVPGIDELPSVCSEGREIGLFGMNRERELETLTRL